MEKFGTGNHFTFLNFTDRLAILQLHYLLSAEIEISEGLSVSMLTNGNTIRVSPNAARNLA
jgi:hypothetical protein